MSQIASGYGFRDFTTIWEHPDNAELKELRQSPNVLLPGDILRIPDKAQKTEARPTTARHRFKLSSRGLLLRLALRDWDNEPLTNTECELEIDGALTALTTDGDGRMEVTIPVTAKGGRLTFKDPLVPFDVSIPIKIGYLDPVEEISGQKARLSNLGYITRPLAEVDDTFFDHAVQEFQCDFGLTVTGECDAETQAVLKDLHGS